MSADPSPLTPDELPDVVSQVIADVLMVPRERVRADSALIEDLGAESLDFLDLVFRLEEALATSIPVERWYEFVRARAADGGFGPSITTDWVIAFARREVREGARG
jgi:acyl carrier protein